jgi:hypothetical protein
MAQKERAINALQIIELINTTPLPESITVALTAELNRLYEIETAATRLIMLYGDSYPTNEHAAVRNLQQRLNINPTEEERRRAWLEWLQYERLSDNA